MTERRPLVLVDGRPAVLPSGDTTPVAAHAHAVGDLTQSGATTGQAVVWNGAAWAPGDVAASVTLAGNREVATGKPPDSTDSRLRGPHTTQYLSNPDGEISNADWECYADAAGAVPVDGIGGSPTVTLTRTTSAPLRGTGSLLLTKDAANRQGEGAAIGFTIDAADCNRSLTISGICSISTGYVAGDVTIHVYNITTGMRAPISGGNAINAGGGFSLQFTADANTSYRLCFHVASTNAAAWTLKLDDLYVGPAWAPSVGAMTDWQDGGAIVLGSTGTSPTKGATSKDRIWWRRSGDSVQLYVEYVQSATGSPGSGYYKISLPAGLTIDTSKVTTKAPGGGSADCGHDHIGTGSVGSDGSCGPAFVYAASSTELWVEACTINGSAAATPWGASNYPVSSGGLRVSFSTMPIPIAGWSGSQAVQPGSRYLWAQRFAANAVRVTTTPSKLGEYRFQINGSDIAPSTLPSAANGFYFYISYGVTALDIFVGCGKSYALQCYLSAGRTGAAFDLPFNNGANWFGIWRSYDPTTGVLTLRSANSVGINAALSAAITACYLDLLVADDPVAVAMAPSVHVEATTTAGQSLSVNVTDIIWDTKTRDTHGALNAATGVFTAPVAGVYSISASITITGAGAGPGIYKGGVFVGRGSYSSHASFPGCVSLSLYLAAGDTITIRETQSNGSLSTGTNLQRLTIARVGD